VKVLSLISTALLALSLAGAVQAAPAVPAAKANVAPATIVLAHCEENATAPCSLDDPAKAGENDPNAMPPANQHKQAQPDPATPVPEPQTCIMLMLGLVVLGFASRRNASSEKFSG
jgi:hypothetical protein